MTVFASFDRRILCFPEMIKTVSLVYQLPGNNMSELCVHACNALFSDLHQPGCALVRHVTKGSRNKGIKGERIVSG